MVAAAPPADDRARVHPLAVAAAVAGLVAALWAVGWLPALERPGWDLLLRLPHPGGTPAGPFAAVLIDDDAIAALGPLPWPRARLAGLIATARHAGATGVVVDVLVSEPSDEPDDLALEDAVRSGPTVLAAALAPGGGWLLPLARFGGAELAAHAHAEVDRDGVVRSVLTTKQADDLALPALAIAAAGLAGERALFAPGRRLRPDFRQAPAEIPQIGAALLLSDHAAGRLLADRVVLVGAAAAGATDQLFVPVGDRSRPSPGVLVHAAIAAAIVRGGLLHVPPGWLVVAMAGALAAVVQALRQRARRLRRRHLGVTIGLILATGLIGLWTLDVLVPMASMVTALAATVVLREAAESRIAQRETDTILAALIEEQPAVDPLPAGVQGRLQLARQLQSQLARDRNLRRTLLEGLAEGIVLWDAAGAVLVANRAAASLWGAVPDLDQVRAAAGHETPLERCGRTLEVAIQPLPPGWLGLLRDVTDRIALERQRREMQRLVSHELKTPLASIAGFGEMLATYELSPDELQRVAGLVRTEADRLGEMVRAFLDLERMDAGAWDDAIAPVDLGVLVQRRCELLEQGAADHARHLAVSSQSGLVIRGVERLLEQLVDNLVGNALKYSPEGAAVTVELAAVGGRVRLLVADQGPGIPPDAVSHLFERFYRVPGTQREGSGLGLAIVKEVADWHRAHVSVDTAPGQGTRMMVTFEAAPEVAS